MNFLEFKLRVLGEVFPDQAPENLVSLTTQSREVRIMDNRILDCLIDLQIKVPCLRQNHTDYICPEATFFHCGSSVFEAPHGFIYSLSTIVPGDNCCAKVRYNSCSKEEMDCLIQDAESVVTWPCGGIAQPYAYYLVNDAYVAYPELALQCFAYPNESDKPCRAISGFFTIYRGQIWMTPSLQGNENVVLDWDGIKRTWADADVMDEVIWSRETQEAAVYYLIGKSAAIDDCDYERGAIYENENPGRPGKYQVKRGELIHTCQKENRPPPRNYCFSTC